MEETRLLQWSVIRSIIAIVQWDESLLCGLALNDDLHRLLAKHEELFDGILDAGAAGAPLIDTGDGNDAGYKFAKYEKKYAEEDAELKSIITGTTCWLGKSSDNIQVTADATRNLSQACLNALAPAVPGLIGGSTDLDSSNMMLLKMSGDFQKGTPEERNVRFGVREHGMRAICNVIALHSPGNFLCVHGLYERGHEDLYLERGWSYIYQLGEDGPTHQPIEHLASFRAMPNMLMFRPADENETDGAYKVDVINKKRPSILAFSRKKLPNLPGTPIEGVEKGGYTISDNSTGNKPDVILTGTGSELVIVAKAADELRKEGKAVRVVSFVSWELFDEHSA